MRIIHPFDKTEQKRRSLEKFIEKDFNRDILERSERREECQAESKVFANSTVARIVNAPYLDW